jgi:hypothetical protein
MAMPKATIYKHGYASRGKNKIRLSNKRIISAPAADIVGAQGSQQG